MSTVIITGGTGLIGKALTRRLLADGNEVIIFSRHPASAGKQSELPHPKLSYAHWDPSKKQIEEDALSRADHIIHLAGAGVADRRWTKSRKELIRNSRVEGGELLAESLAKYPNRIESIIAASGIGWYGPDPKGKNSSSFKESDPAFPDFLGETCRQWEQSSQASASLGKRVVLLRTGIVLAKEGGALPRFIQPMKWGIAPVLGSAKQVISWIHIEDLVSIYATAVSNTQMQGVYNAVSPSPVSNREFVTALRKLAGSRAIKMRVPSFVLKTVLGEMSVEVLKSATVSADKLLATGFRFRFPELNSALKDLLDQEKLRPGPRDE